MNPIDQELRESLLESQKLPEGPWRFLYIGWLCIRHRLATLGEEANSIGPPNLRTDDLAAWMRNSKKHTDEIEQLIRQRRRIESYLGPQRINRDASMAESSYLSMARWVRRMAANGDSDEAIASFLKHSAESDQTRKEGRPVGSGSYDAHVMEAFTLRKLDPAYWSFPRLADQFSECKCPRPHQTDSPCVGKLKKAVGRLRNFLQELGYKPAGK